MTDPADELSPWPTTPGQRRLSTARRLLTVVDQPNDDSGHDIGGEFQADLKGSQGQVPGWMNERRDRWLQS